MIRLQQSRFPTMMTMFISHFLVTDEYHENSANSAWNGDSVQLMIANDKQDTQIALYNYALGGVEDDLGGQVMLEEAGR